MHCSMCSAIRSPELEPARGCYKLMFMLAVGLFAARGMNVC